MTDESPPSSTDRDNQPAARPALGVCLHAGGEPPDAARWADDCRVALARGAQWLYVTGLPANPARLPTDASAEPAFRRVDALLDLAGPAGCRVALQIGGPGDPATLPAARRVPARYRGRAAAYVFCGEGAGPPSSPLKNGSRPRRRCLTPFFQSEKRCQTPPCPVLQRAARSLVSLVRIARQADPAAEFSVLAAADDLVALRAGQPEEFEQLDFLLVRPPATTDHRGWTQRAADAAAGSLAPPAGLGKPIWAAGLLAAGSPDWAPLVPEEARAAGAVRLLQSLAAAGVRTAVFDDPPPAGCAAFAAFATDGPTCRVEVFPLRIRSDLPAELPVRLTNAGEAPVAGRLRLEYAGGVGEQAAVHVAPGSPLELTLTLQPQRLSAGVNPVFVRFAMEGEPPRVVYGFGEVVRPVRVRLARLAGGRAVRCLPSAAEVAAFFERHGGDVAILVGRAGAEAAMAAELAGRLHHWTGRRVDVRLAAAGADVLDRPLILLTVGESNFWARLAQQPIARGRITARSPAAGRGRIIRVPSPLGDGPGDPRAAAVGLYYEDVSDALIVGGGDEPGLRAAVDALLGGMQPERTSDA